MIPHDPHCISCQTVSGTRSVAGGIVYANAGWLVVLREEPPVPGYLFVISKRHVERVADLCEEETASLGDALRCASRALERVFQPERVYCASYGEEVRHVHFHVYPRLDAMPRGNAAMTRHMGWRRLMNRMRLSPSVSDAEIAAIADRLRVALSDSERPLSDAMATFP